MERLRTQDTATIIAGPCSIDENNLDEIIHGIAEITVYDGAYRGIKGTRTVGLKSRTALDVSGKGMGIDWDAIQQMRKLPERDRLDIIPPSVQMAEIIRKETGLRSEEHTSELQSPDHLVCRLLLEKKNNIATMHFSHY